MFRNGHAAFSCSPGRRVVKPRRPIPPAAVLLFWTLSSAATAADETRFSASLGAFINERDSDTRIDASASLPPGTDVDLEGDFGFDKSDSVFRFDGYWRFADKHRIDVSAFDLSRSSVKNIDRDITIGDTTFPVDTEVSGESDLSIYKASYSWLFRRRENYSLGASVGLYVADIGVKFTGPRDIDRESRDITAPLPVVGFRGERALSERWKLRGSAEIFVFSYNAFDGRLYDVFVGADFSVADHAALGLGFNAVSFDLTIDDNKLDGELEWSYSGAIVYLKLDF